MREKPLPRVEIHRIRTGFYASQTNDLHGAFHIGGIAVMSSGTKDNDGWEHVSVSLANRTPTWEEMCKIKEIFWSDEETVVQFHPKKSEYVNNHPFCLHMWRKSNSEFELPPHGLVGSK